MSFLYLLAHVVCTWLTILEVAARIDDLDLASGLAARPFARIGRPGMEVDIAAALGGEAVESKVNPRITEQLLPDTWPDSPPAVPGSSSGSPATPGFGFGLGLVSIGPNSLFRVVGRSFRDAFWLALACLSDSVWFIFRTGVRSTILIVSCSEITRCH